MKLIKFLCVALISYSNYCSANDRFLSANEIGSWAWSGFNLYTAHLLESDVKDISESGAKLARFHLEATRCPQCTKYSVSMEDLNRLDKIVGYAKIHGIKIIIVLDPFPRAKDADYWTVDERHESLNEIWKNISKRFARETTVAAFDILNEPHPPDVHSWSGGSEMWSQLSHKFAMSIRQNAPNQVLIVESTPIALPGAFGNFKPIGFGNVVYSFHFYEPHRLTHQGILGFPLGLDYPGYAPGVGYWNRDRLSSSIQAVRDFQAKYRVPVQVGEFGFIRFGQGGSRYRYISDFLDIVYKEQWGWLYHSFREWNGWDAEIDSNQKEFTKRTVDSPDFQLLKSYLAKPAKMQ